MTDLPPDPLDELASAHLDGATTPEEAARVEADPALRARVEAMRRVRGAVGAVGPGDPDERAATVAAVLARLDDGGSVTPLRPTAGPTRAARTWRALAAAAAVAVVALLIPLLARDDEPETSFEATSGPLADRSAGEAEDAAGGAPEPGVTTSTIVGALPELGAFSSVEELLAAPFAPSPPAAAYGADGEERDDGQDPVSTTVEGVASVVPQPCAAARASSVGPGTLVGQATVADRPVIVVSYDGRLLVLDRGSCAVLADRRG